MWDNGSDDVQRISTVLFLKWVRGLLMECNWMLTSITDTVLMSLYKVCVKCQHVCVLTSSVYTHDGHRCLQAAVTVCLSCLHSSNT